MMRYIPVLFAAVLAASCELGTHTINTGGTGSGTVKIGSTTYAITKSVVSPSDVGGGEYYMYVDLLQSGVKLDSSSFWDSATSDGLAFEFQIYAPNDERQGNFTLETSPAYLDWVYSELFSGGGGTNILDDSPDSGGVEISISGSNITITGSLRMEAYINGEWVPDTLVTYDYNGLFTSIAPEGNMSIAPTRAHLKLRH